MDHTSLIDDARAATGLEDFGADGWREGLERYVAALDAEADLTELGGLATQAQIVANLVNRLRVTAWWAEHPDLGAQRIERPHHRARAAAHRHDPRLRAAPPRSGESSLLRWEARSVGAAAARRGHGDRPARRGGTSDAGGMDALNPGFKAIHFEAPDGPTECVAVLAQDFKSLLWSSDHQRAVVRRMAARLRRDLGVRVPPPSAGAAAVRRARAVGAEDAAPLPRASTRSCRSTPTRALRHDTPRPGDGDGVGVQPACARSPAPSATPTTASHRRDVDRASRRRSSSG